MLLADIGSWLGCGCFCFAVTIIAVLMLIGWVLSSAPQVGNIVREKTALTLIEIILSLFSSR